MLFRCLVDPHFFGLAPAAGAPASALWIDLAGGLVDLGSLLANDLGCSTVALVGRHKFDAAVVIQVVVKFQSAAIDSLDSSLLAKGQLAGLIQNVS